MCCWAPTIQTWQLHVLPTVEPLIRHGTRLAHTQQTHVRCSVAASAAAAACSKNNNNRRWFGGGRRKARRSGRRRPGSHPRARAALCSTPNPLTFTTRLLLRAAALLLLLAGAAKARRPAARRGTTRVAWRAAAALQVRLEHMGEAMADMVPQLVALLLLPATETQLRTPTRLLDCNVLGFRAFECGPSRLTSC